MDKIDLTSKISLKTIKEGSEIIIIRQYSNMFK